MHDRNIVVAGDNVSKGTEFFFNSLDLNILGQRISYGLKFIICSVVWQKESIGIACAHAANNLALSDWAGNNGHVCR